MSTSKRAINILQQFEHLPSQPTKLTPCVLEKTGPRSETSELVNAFCTNRFDNSLYIYKLMTASPPTGRTIAYIYVINPLFSLSLTHSLTHTHNLHNWATGFDVSSSKIVDERYFPPSLYKCRMAGNSVSYFWL